MGKETKKLTIKPDIGNRFISGLWEKLQWVKRQKKLTIKPDIENRFISGLWEKM
jgi:hypothetical protein